jgi:hypothetical protein
MEPMTSLLADLAFGLAFVALICILYIIGRHHAPCRSTGRAMWHGRVDAASSVSVQGETVQRHHMPKRLSNDGGKRIRNYARLSRLNCIIRAKWPANQ